MSELICKEYRKGILMKLALYHIYDEMTNEKYYWNLPARPFCNKQVRYNCMNRTMKYLVAIALDSGLALTCIDSICLEEKI